MLHHCCLMLLIVFLHGSVSSPTNISVLFFLLKILFWHSAPARLPDVTNFFSPWYDVLTDHHQCIIFLLIILLWRCAPALLPEITNCFPPWFGVLTDHYLCITFSINNTFNLCCYSPRGRRFLRHFNSYLN